MIQAFQNLLKKTLMSFVMMLSVAALAQSTPLSPEAQDVLRKGGQAAALALASYDEHFIDKPLWREAVNYGLELQRLAPNNEQTYRYLGQVYSSINFYSRAWTAWEKYIELGGVMNAQTAPYLKEVSSWLGNKSFREENYDDAILYYQALFELEPESEEANQHLALSYIEQGLPAQATAYLETLTEAFPNKAYYVNLLSRTEEQASYGVDASKYFYEGLDLFATGNKSGALESLNRATNLSPSYRKAFVWAGRISQDLGNPNLASRYWSRALELNPFDNEAQEALARAEGQKTWGIEAYNLFAQGLRFYQQGKRGEALWSFQEASKINPVYSEAWAWLGQMAVENRDFQSAQNYYLQARRLAPDELIYESAYNEASRLLSQQVQAASQPVVQPPAQTTVAEIPAIPTQTNVEQPVVSQPSTATAVTEPIAPPVVQTEAVVSIPETPRENLATAEIITPPTVAVPTPQVSSSLEPAPVTTQTNVATTLTPTEIAVPVISASVAPTPTLNPVPTPALEVAVATPVPIAEPSRLSGGPAVTLLNLDYLHQTAEQGGTGAFSFFDTPASMLSNLNEPSNYAEGTLYQRIQITSKPSGDPVRYQLCLVHNDSLSIGPACSTSDTLVFEEPGVFEVSQPLSSLTNYNEIDWSRGLQQIMLILQDEEGNTLDDRVAFQTSNNSIDIERYYPMKVRYQAILVPFGGRFPGWP